MRRANHTRKGDAGFTHRTNHTRKGDAGFINGRQTQLIAPPQGQTQPGMKPTTPMHGGRRSHLKPVTPLHGSNRPKQAHSHPQRRYLFHAPHQPHQQRRRRFHKRANLTVTSNYAGTQPSFFDRFWSPSVRSRDVSNQVSVFHACFTLTDASGHGHHEHHRAHGHATLPTECRQVSDRSDGRSVRVGGARREEWGHGR